MSVRRRLIVTGAVQGVGFRPFVRNLAVEMGLAGSVWNTPAGAELEVEGPAARLEEFAARLTHELPRPGFVRTLVAEESAPTGEAGFVIVASQAVGARSALVLPDLAPCPRCLAEMRDPHVRRYRYAFTNCTHCGPRYSIIRALPYDRASTTMARFTMCPRCQAEYDDPSDRRYHAQPNACPECGPQVELWDGDGACLHQGWEAIRAAAQVVRDGQILALKGVGGFHLIVDAARDDAVARLRARKRREAKPLAVMSPDLEDAARLAELSDAEAELLADPSTPIVIVRGKNRVLADSVAPGNPNLGLMLPSSPLHHLLMSELARPVVCTSGNLSDEPICTDELEAVTRFRDLADALLVHDRPIQRPIDDSVMRVMPQGPMAMRRARGLAPLPLPVADMKSGWVGVGAHLKNSVAVSLDGAVVVGQHVGDLDHPTARERMKEEIVDLQGLHDLTPLGAAHDLHPDYASTWHAASLEVECCPVQHHLAHAMAGIAELELTGPVLAVVWDGVGLGDDGGVWGGEFIVVDGRQARRVGSLRPFVLPGGDAAARECRRSLWGALYAAFGDDGITMAEDALGKDSGLKALLKAGIRCPATTSAGRLFDAAAAIGAGILASRFEGDAAMRWECLAHGHQAEPYAVEVRPGVDGRWELDWSPTVWELLSDRSPSGKRSAAFHASMALGIGEMAQRVGVQTVLLTGGCFQNRLLSELAWADLGARGLAVHGHRTIPPNDGGIAFGQVVAAARGVRLI